MKISNFVVDVALPQGVTAEIAGYKVKIKGPKGEVEKKLANLHVKIEKQGNKMVVSAKNATKREKTAIGTFEAHLKNMVAGVTHGHVYKMKICSGHFPMNVSVSGNDFIVSNFLGEKTPRNLKIKNGATVNVNGQEVVVESTDKETAGQVAADIEMLTKVKGRDKRIFQDGIYIINKDGKVLG